MPRRPRFPDIDWYCDHCGAYLNSQRRFNDHKYIWKCTECGFKNSLSWDNISPGDHIVTQYFLHFLGILSYVGFWTTVMLAVAMFGFHADRTIYSIPFFGSLGLYLFAFAVSIFVEFAVRHTYFSVKSLFYVIFRNLMEDLICPFRYIKELISNLLSFITSKLPIKRKYVWYSNKKIVAFAIVYTIIAIMEIVALSKIVDYSFRDWIALISEGLEWVSQLLGRI